MSQENKPNTPKINPKHKARALALQALYQWDMTRQSAQEILTQFMTEQDLSGANQKYFTQLVEGVFTHLDQIDDVISPKLDRDRSELNPVELAVLRVATYELLHCLNVPYKVVINEAIELTKEFGANQGHKYVNGVLDALAAESRSIEIQSK